VKQAKVFGLSIPRREDGRFLDGSARYIADVRLPDMAEAVVLRSPVAHALIVDLDVTEARALPGVIAVITASDLAVESFTYRPYHKSVAEFTELVDVIEKHHDVPLLADDRVRRVGEPVAFIVADDRYIAEDARDLIRLDLEELEPVLDPERGLEPDAPVIHDELGDNLQARVTVSSGDLDGAFAAAEHTASFRFKVGRSVASPIENRGVIAAWDPEDGGMTVWSATQMPHLSRKVVGGILGIAAEDFRVICPDMGGSFGGGVYYEDILVPYLAKLLGRPVRWLEDRAENLVNARHARDQIHEVEVAYDASGRIHALRDRILVDMGLASFYGLVVPYNTISHLRGPYRIDNYWCRADIVITNKTPNAPARGAGRVSASFVMERILELIARRVNRDPAEVRLKNLIPGDVMPYDMGIPYRDGNPVVYDSGDYPAQLRMALDAVDYAGFRERQKELRDEGRFVGIGLAAYMEGTGYGPHEGAVIRVDLAGNVTILSGSNNHGQSHETTLAQVCADVLGVDIERISLRDGDTSLIQHGGGTFASRTAVTGGMAVAGAAALVRDKALGIAAHRLGLNKDELGLIAGHVCDASGKALMSLGEVAAIALPGSGVDLPAGVGPGLEALHYYVPPTVTWSSGTHAVTVEVDRQTGCVQLDRYVVAHDCGNMINPAVVEGQVVGGVVHGIGNALYEEEVYDELGTPLATTLLDYHLPRAIDVPRVEVYHQEFPSPLNELGVKGCGEGGTVAAPAAIINAVEDAMKPLELGIMEMPLQPEKLLRAIDAAEAGTPE
jgi:carbon-monoxide dehydrogenase large subunit